MLYREVSASTYIMNWHYDVIPWHYSGHSFTPPWVATSAGLAPLRRSGLTLLLSRVGLMRLEIIN